MYVSAPEEKNNAIFTMDHRASPQARTGGVTPKNQKGFKHRLMKHSMEDLNLHGIRDKKDD